MHRNWCRFRPGYLHSLVPSARDHHPRDEDLSPGTPDRGHPHLQYPVQVRGPGAPGRFRYGPHSQGDIRNRLSRRSSPETAQPSDRLPELTTHVCATLQCIRALGPDEALKEHATRTLAIRTNGSAKGRRPILNPNAIAKAMGTDRYTVHTICARQESFFAAHSMQTANCF